MQTSILIRTFVADGARLTLHVGGGITWRSDPAAEWDETVAKARGPLSAIGGRRGRRRREASTERPGPRLGRRPAPAGRRRRTSRCSTAASSWATASSRRSAPAAAARPSSPSTSPGCAARPTGSTSRCPTTLDARLARGHRASCSRPRASTGPTATPRSGSRSRAARSSAAACCRPTSTPTPTIAIQAWPVVAAAGRPPRARPPPRRDARPARPGRTRSSTLKTTSRADYVYARLEARRAGADDALFLTIDGHLSEATTANVFLVRGGDGASSRRRRSTARSCRARPARGCSRWAARVGLRPVEGLADAARPRRRRRGVPVARASPGSCRSPASTGAPIGDGRPGPWTLRARADREAFIRGADAVRLDDDAATSSSPRTRQLIDEGERLQAEPVARRASRSGSSSRTTCSSRRGADGPLPPRVADGRQAEGHRPRPADDARRGGGLRPRGRRGRRPPRCG